MKIYGEERSNLTNDRCEEDIINVYDISIVETDTCRNNALLISYDYGNVGECEYLITFGNRKYNENTDTFNREILAFSNGLDSENDKSLLIKLFNNIIEQAIVVD